MNNVFEDITLTKEDLLEFEKSKADDSIINYLFEHYEEIFTDEDLTIDPDR